MTGPEAVQGLARGIHVAATMSIFGSALFQALVAPPVLASTPAAALVRRRLAALAWISLAVALVAALGWLGFQAAAFADGDSLGAILAAVPLILFDTHFGPLIAARLVLLVAACLILGGIVPRRPATLALAALLGAGAIELQVPLGHGIAMAGGNRMVLIASEVLHLLGAGAWLGGLLPLMLTIASMAPAESSGTVQRFSRLGTACVSALAVTSLVQAWILVGGLPALIGTDYGRLASAKLVLFIALLLLAARNRFQLRPNLAGPSGEATRRRLVSSILAETVLGFGVLALAGMLLMLAPGVHQQPDWPFRWAVEFSFPAGPRIVSAHPTTFYHSPTGFTAASIVHGRKLFADNCATCHVIADPQAARLGDRRDGDLYWLLAHGTDRMPRFGDKLGSGDLWSVIDYLKARDIARRGAATPFPLAPDIPVAIGGKTVPLSRLRGSVIRLVLLDKGEPLSPLPDVLNLRIDPDSDGWSAYAIVAATDDTRLRHFTFLVDSGGRLRGVYPPRPDGSTDSAAFSVGLASLAE